MIVELHALTVPGAEAGHSRGENPRRHGCVGDENALLQKLVNLMRLVDAMMAFPDILLAISLVAILSPSLSNVVLALVLVYAPRVARVVRASTLVVRELLYVEAARALGMSTARILWRHILPNLMSPILVQLSFIFAYALLAEAGHEESEGGARERILDAALRVIPRTGLGGATIERIAREGSISAAGRSMNMSYKRAWELSRRSTTASPSPWSRPRPAASRAAARC